MRGCRSWTDPGDRLALDEGEAGGVTSLLDRSSRYVCGPPILTTPSPPETVLGMKEKRP
jgi:hypothetical protein